MIGKLFLLTTLAVAYGRPGVEETRDWTWVEDPACPPIHHHWLLPHETDCTKFYYCEYGMKRTDVRDCAPGTVFSYLEQVCVHSADGGCHESPSQTEAPATPEEPPTPEEPQTPEEPPAPEEPQTPEEPPTPEEPETPEPNTPEEDCEDEIEYLPNGCPVSEEYEQLFPHEQCGKYYQCVHGEKVERYCNDGLYFNPETLKCDYPEESGCTGLPGTGDNESGGNCDETCGNGNEDDEENNGSEDAGSSDAGDDCEDDGGSEPGELLPNGCPVNYLEEKLYPSETCGHYLQCVHGNLVERMCALGTHFNYETQRCDLSIYVCDPNWGNGGEDNNGNCDGTCGNGDDDNNDNGSDNGGNGELLPNGCPVDYLEEKLYPSETCGHYLQCVHGNLVERMCALGTHFNYETQRCDLSIYICDPNWGNGGDDNNGNCDGTCGNGDDDNNDNGSDNGGNGELLPNGCPVDYLEEKLYPSETCGHYLQCVHGNLVERMCALGTHFNYETQRCDLSIYVCDPNWGNGGDDNNGNCDGTCGNGDDDNNDNGSDNGGNGELLPNGCPVDYLEEKLYPSETCGHYLQCVHGNLVERMCALGTHFNYETQRCDLSIYVCDPNWGNGGDDNNGNCDGTCGNGDDDNNDNGSDNGGNGELLPNGCPVDYLEEKLYPSETCGHYLQCVHGNLVERMCALGTHFNYETQTCDLPREVCDPNWGNGGENDNNNCDGTCDNGEDDNGDDNGGAGGQCPLGFEDGLLYPSENCGNYLQCSNGKLTEMSCPSGLHFNPTTQKCDWPELAGCDANIGNICAENCNYGPWANEHDCRSFWRCQGSNLVLVTCPEGLFYNILSRTCDFKENVTCSPALIPDIFNHRNI